MEAMMHFGSMLYSSLDLRMVVLLALLLIVGIFFALVTIPDAYDPYEDDRPPPRIRFRQGVKQELVIILCVFGLLMLGSFL